jgi:hypothetical protein
MLREIQPYGLMQAADDPSSKQVPHTIVRFGPELAALPRSRRCRQVHIHHVQVGEWRSLQLRADGGLILPSRDRPNLVTSGHFSYQIPSDAWL